MQVDEYLFDEEDRAIFKSKDLDLKAKVLRYHLMPRLEQLFRKMLSQATDIFGGDTLEFSTISRSPGFRTDRRKGDVKIDYDHCFVGLCGKRKPLWTKVRRKKDGMMPKVFWFNWGLELTEGGLRGVLTSPQLTPLDNFSYQTVLIPIIAHSGQIREVFDHNDISVQTSADDEDRFQQFHDRIAGIPMSQDPWFSFATGTEEFPISVHQGEHAAYCMAELFPIYDAILRSAQGLEHRIPEHLTRLNEHYVAIENEEDEEHDEAIETSMLIDLNQLSIERTFALPGKRYQVFQRDGWKCVICGKHPENAEVVLHVDHILPKSKGGADELDNYQTLCDLCNLGKGNRDSTNIRAHRSTESKTEIDPRTGS